MSMAIFLAVAGLAAGLVLLETGADRFTDAIAALARRLNASEHAVALLVAGGEWEELVVVALAILAGHPGLAIGAIVGSCLANLIGSMPLGFFGARPVVPDRGARASALVMLAVTLVAAALLADGYVSPLAGGALVALFVLYVAVVVAAIARGWMRPVPVDIDDDEVDDAAGGSLRRAIAMVVVGLAAIGIGAELVVLGAVEIARQVGLSDYAIGATVVAVGATLPDKAISFVGGRRGQGGVVTANATGSNIFVLTLVLGLAAAFSGAGLVVPPGAVRIDLVLLVAASAAVAVLFRRPALHRGTGAVLLVLYVAYVVYALVRGE